MTKVKRIILIVIATICCIAVLTGATICSLQPDSSTCERVDVVVKDSTERQYVSATELEYYLKSQKLYCQGHAMESIDCHVIEQALLKHKMIRTATCYKNPFGAVQVRVTQRVPVLCVKGRSEVYLVDMDRNIMPYPKCGTVDVPVFTGSVTKSVATTEYYDFVMWLKGNSYWSKRIKSVYVKSSNYLVLSQEDHDAKIILGRLDDYENKLDRLRTLYKKGFEKVGYPECRELDLRFDGQVVKR